MTFSQALLIGIVFVPLALVLFNRLRMDAAALIIAAGLGAAQFLGAGMIGPANTPGDAVKAILGFGQPVVLTLASLFIISHTLEKSGVTRWIVRRLLLIGGQSESRLIALFSGTAAGLSLFMNNVAAGALILPSALEAARSTGIRPSKLLIPVAYGSMLGGAATYFTTANIIVSDLLRIARPPQAPLHILDFTPTGGLIAIVGVAFLALAGRRLLPDRAPSPEQMFARPTGSELEESYRIGERLWAGLVRHDSPFNGLTIQQSAIGHNYGVLIVGIRHGSQAISAPAPSQVIREDDILLIVGREDRVSLLDEVGITIESDVVPGKISPSGVTVVEVMPAPRSKALGKTLKSLDFRKKYGMMAIALWRGNRSYRTNVGDFELQVGDSLLVIGSHGHLKRLRRDPDYIVLEPSQRDQPVNRREALVALGTVAGAILLSVLGMPVFLAMLLGALVIILSGLVTMEEAYSAIEWQAIILVAGMYAVSLAMVQTGLALRLGDVMFRLAAPFGPLGLAAGAYLLSALLTQVMGGQVTALVTGPVAISAALSMGTSPQAIAVATAIGCSAAFLTPLSHPVNILMITPANYTFSDFFRVGWPLTLLCFAALLVGMVLFWPL